MLQGGGGNNQSAALLREVFQSECKHRQTHETEWKRKHQSPRKAFVSPRNSPRIAGSGLSAASGLSAGRRGVRRRIRSASCRRGQHGQDIEQSHKGYGWGVALPSSIPPPPPPREPVHGMKPPYQRRAVTRQFNDDLQGGIACLCPPVRDRMPHGPTQPHSP
eukprot:Hpha_TRINITY_DN8374_c0_g2::TRINITY_DN8374_c0_g2_i1::g.154314::m.154314